MGNYSSCVLLIIIVSLLSGIEPAMAGQSKPYVVSFLQLQSPCSILQNWEGAFDWKNPINDLVLKIIHEIQIHMHDGIPPYIPPLDPLNISKYDFDVQESGFKAKGSLRDMIVKNLSTFNVTNIDTNLLKRSVNVSVEILNLQGTGTYTLDGKALSFIPVTGSGPFILIPKDTKCTTHATLGYQEGHFVLDTFDYEVTIGGIYAKFDGIYGGGMISDLLNSILNRFAMTLFYKLEPLVHEDIRKVLMDDIDRLLRDIKISDLGDFPVEELLTCFQ